MTTSPHESESELLTIEDVERQISLLRHEQEQTQAHAKDLLHREDPSNGVFFHQDIFRLQQDKLRIETEIQFLQIKLRRLKAVW